MSSQIYTYNKNSLLADYAKSAIGIILTATPVLFLEVMSWLQVILIMCLILFIVFGIRTFFRQKSNYYFDELTLHQTGLFPKSLNLDDLAILDVRYFSTRKARDVGWFQIKIVAGDIKIVVDSSLNGFDNFIKIVAEAAHKNNLLLDAITNDNLTALLKQKRQ